MNGSFMTLDDRKESFMTSPTPAERRESARAHDFAEAPAPDVMNDSFMTSGPEAQTPESREGLLTGHQSR